MPLGLSTLAIVLGFVEMILLDVLCSNRTGVDESVCGKVLMARKCSIGAEPSHHRV